LWKRKDKTEGKRYRKEGGIDERGGVKTLVRKSTARKKGERQTRI